MPTGDGHHRRGLSGVNAGAGVEDVIARLLQLDLHLAGVQQRFGTPQRIGSGIFQYLQSGVRVAANGPQCRRNRQPDHPGARYRHTKAIFHQIR